MTPLAALEGLLAKASDKTLPLPEKIAAGKAYALAAMDSLPALIARIKKLEWALKCIRDREDSKQTVRIAEEALADKEVS